MRNPSDKNLPPTVAWKTGWVLLTFSSPSVVHNGVNWSRNSIEVYPPRDMPFAYIKDACPTYARHNGYYECFTEALEDGWEPVSVGEYVGGTLGYGRLYSFKKKITYNPGLYIPRGESNE